MGIERLTKIREMRALAEQFRERATATGMPQYIELMMQTARELDEFADLLERDVVVNQREHGGLALADCAA